MFNDRILRLQSAIKTPILIKKKENLLYLTGRVFMHGYLLVKPKGAERRGTNTTRTNAEKLSVVFLGDGLEQPPKIHSGILKNIGMYLGRQRVLEIEDVFSFVEFKYIKSKLRPSLLNPPPRGGRKVGVMPVRSPVDYQRMIKEPKEIALIRKSMQIVEKVFEQVKYQLKKSSWTEIKLAEFIKTAGFKLGAQDVSFPPIVASGANAAVPHHVASQKRLKAGESIIIDFGFSAGGGSAFGGKFPGYCSDFTRTVFLKRVPSKLEKAYNQVEKAYEESMDFINHPSPALPIKGREIKSSSPFEGGGKVGVKAGDVYQKAVDVLAEKKLDKYFIHSLGHGTGLEIHELPNLSPKSKDILREGMVISIEPGVYIPNLGGIRIEDLVYLEKEGVKKFINISTNLNQNIL